MATKAKRSVSAPRRPEKKWGPFAGGCGVAVWLNEVQTAAGPGSSAAIHCNPGDTGTYSDGFAMSTRTPAGKLPACTSIEI